MLLFLRFVSLLFEPATERNDGWPLSRMFPSTKSFQIQDNRMVKILSSTHHPQKSAPTLTCRKKKLKKVKIKRAMTSKGGTRDCRRGSSGASGRGRWAGNSRQ
jgi:hypothetical protein